jgi:hypothetical protein
MWRDTFANAREHEETGKIPRLVFEHEERPLLAPLRKTSFDTDDLETTGVGRTHRVHFDRNDYTVPWRLHGQSLLIRANDETVRMMLSSKEIARHPRCWSVREDIEAEHHEDGMRGERGRPAANALPDVLSALGEIGASYFSALLASRRSIRAEQVRLVLLSELFGASETASAMHEVMRTGHVGAEYVEYVMRHKRKLIGAARALLDPGEPPHTSGGEEAP